MLCGFLSLSVFGTVRCLQIQCRADGCGKWIEKNKDRLCKECNHKRRYPSAQDTLTVPRPLSTLEQIGTNATALVQSLPPHSHHRGPLLHFLSQNITSTEAAVAFTSSASYIRDCKRKNMDASDLVNQKYSDDTKRQRLSDDRVNHLMNFITDNCPPKSGSATLMYRQYVGDQELYDRYLSAPNPANVKLICFNTFVKHKKWLRVRKLQSYWGQFSCSKCLELKRLRSDLAAIGDVDRLNRIRLSERTGQVKDLLYHRIQYFTSAINTS